MTTGRAGWFGRHPRAELPAGDSEHFRDLELVRKNLSRRHRRGLIWAAVFQLSTMAAVVALCALLFNIVNESFGLVALEYEVPPASVLPAGRAASELSRDELIAILRAHTSSGLLRRWDYERPLAQRTQADVLELVLEEVLNQNAVRSWNLVSSIFRAAEIEKTVREDLPEAELQFRSWIGPRFVARPQSADPDRAGIRPAILGTLWMILITVIVAFPLGVGAAIYLEEYARDTDAQPHHPGEHLQPRRRALDHLRHARPRGVRALSGAGHQRSGPGRRPRRRPPTAAPSSRPASRWRCSSCP